MAVGLDDSTIGRVVNSYCTDEVRDLEKFKSYKGTLLIKVDSILVNGSINISVPTDVVSITAVQINADVVKFIDLKEKVKNGKIAFKGSKQTG